MADYAMTNETTGIAAMIVELDPLARPWRSLPVPPDSFPDDQQNAYLVAGMNPEQWDEWMNSLTYAESIDVLRTLDQIASEHRARAESAAALADRIRQKHAEVSHFGHDTPMPTKSDQRVTYPVAG